MCGPSAPQRRTLHRCEIHFRVAVIRRNDHLVKDLPPLRMFERVHFYAPTPLPTRPRSIATSFSAIAAFFAARDGSPSSLTCGFASHAFNSASRRARAILRRSCSLNFIYHYLPTVTYVDHALDCLLGACAHADPKALGLPLASNRLCRIVPDLPA